MRQPRAGSDVRLVAEALAWVCVIASIALGIAAVVTRDDGSSDSFAMMLGWLSVLGWGIHAAFYHWRRRWGRRSSFWTEIKK